VTPGRYSALHVGQNIKLHKLTIVSKDGNIPVFDDYPGHIHPD
jgi:hypothetical protein